jgi:4-hydroxy-tetrahydrodipicolinate reductase
MRSFVGPAFDTNHTVDLTMALSPEFESDRPSGLAPMFVLYLCSEEGYCSTPAPVKRAIKIAQFGLGPIGIECLKLAASRPWARIIGAIDIDPDKVGVDLGAVTGERSLRGLCVVNSVGELVEKPDMIFHTAVSRFSAAFAQITPLARQGIHVVSSCEELVFPWLREPNLADKLDRVCHRSGARVMGTGVNPGFVMDLLPLCLTSVISDVRAINVQRVVNASTRRESLQRKIGSGLAPEEFETLLRTGKAGHAGLRESLALIAHALGWRPTRIHEKGHAVVAKKNIRTKYLEVRKGQTCGLHQFAQANRNGKFRLTLDLKMYLDAEDPHDAVQIEGDPPLQVIIKGGVAGDQATVAALVNAVPRLMRVSPGLKLVNELAAA